MEQGKGMNLVVLTKECRDYANLRLTDYSPAITDVLQLFLSFRAVGAEFCYRQLLFPHPI